MRRLTIGNTIIFASVATIFAVTAIFAHQSYQATAYPQQYQGGNDTFGIISSIQNDESGQPAWIVSGHWTSTLTGDNSINANQTTADATAPYTGSPFDTQVEMVMLNGTGGHTHTITNFVLANVSQPDNMTKIFNGTSTASMREGPVTDIPTSIEIIGDKIISIWLDPSKIDNHYGNTPIYGILVDDDEHRPGPLKGNSTQMGK
jgi:hypothetical protein